MFRTNEKGWASNGSTHLALRRLRQEEDHEFEASLRSEILSQNQSRQRKVMHYPLEPIQFIQIPD
jgi:hypothetical protein